MNYQKPELVQMGSAISAIQAGLMKSDGTHDGNIEFTDPVYRADE